MLKEKIYIFGASTAGKLAYEHLSNNFVIQGFIDNDPLKWGTVLFDIPVYTPDVLLETKNPVKVFVASMFFDQIADQLRQMGIKNFHPVSPVKQIKTEIKMVIWDLDDTFWEGTLSEEEVRPNQKNKEMIIELTNRGIINSIASKNNYEEAKQKLLEIGVWDYFVFPSINWLSKGEMVKNIINKAQLRAENVLFIDDNMLNLQEVQWYNLGINVAEIDFIDLVLNHPCLQGKQDESQTRLKQYKILEKRCNDQVRFTNNLDFLGSVDISVSFLDPFDYSDRIVELINRSNQLNYTKNRFGKEQLLDILLDPEYKSQCISARDKFGDYGIIGFYSLHRKTNFLENFIFSCRVLNLGIEQYVYSKLGFPQISIVKPVAVELNSCECPFWINRITTNKQSIQRTLDELDKCRVLLKGGCDLEQLAHYLNYNNFHVKTEFNFSTITNHDIHREHSEFLKDCLLIEQAKKDFLVEKLPFLDEKVYETDVYKDNYDVLVYSTLMDYEQDLYLHKELNVKVAYGTFGNLIEEDRKCFLKRHLQKRKYDMDLKFKKYFEEEFLYIGPIKAEEFYNNLTFIRKKINKPIVFINGAEVEAPNLYGNHVYLRHQYMNKVLNEYVEEHPGCFMLDVRKYVTQSKDLLDSITHYKRVVYAQLANELMEIIKKVR